MCSKWNLGSGGIVVRGRLAVMVARTSASAIGRWTAEMFLLFQLDRPDIWPTGDLGVRRPYGLAWGYRCRRRSSYSRWASRSAGAADSGLTR